CRGWPHGDRRLRPTAGRAGSVPVEISSKNGGRLVDNRLGGFVTARLVRMDGSVPLHIDRYRWKGASVAPTQGSCCKAVRAWDRLARDSSPRWLPTCRPWAS